MRIIFLGTAEFAVPSLEAIRGAGHELALVVTRPDRPAGRGMKLTMPPIKRRALEMNLPVWQPESLESPEVGDRLAGLQPDLLVGVAFGQFIPAHIIKGIRWGGINLHPSLLPFYRGAAPIPWAIIRGERQTGVTVHQIVAKIDAGDVYAQERVPIGPEDDAGSLAARLAPRGAELLVRTIEEIGRGTAVARPQNDSEATFAPKLTKSDGRLDWAKPARSIHDLIRGLNPWPGAYTSIPTKAGRKNSKLFRTGILPVAPGPPGEVLEATGEKLIVRAGEGAIRILELQPEGGRRMTAAEFLRGTRIVPGQRLGRPAPPANLPNQ